MPDRSPANPYPQYKADSAIQIIRRSTDATAVTGSTDQTANVDDQLRFEVYGNSADSYFVEAFLLVNAANATMDAKFGLSYPTGVTAVWGPISTTTGTIGSYTLFTAASTPVALGIQTGTIAQSTVNGTLGLQLGAVVNDGGTAGTVALEWAQNTSDAGALKLLKNSFLRVTKLN